MKWSFISPERIRFSQSSIKGSFAGGGTIDELADCLKNKTIAVGSIPPIRLMEKNGELFTLDNRRLEAFRRAGVPVPHRMALPEEIANEA